MSAMKLNDAQILEFESIAETSKLKELSERFDISQAVASRMRKRVREGLPAYDEQLLKTTRSVATAKQSESKKYHGSPCNTCKGTLKWISNNVCVACNRVNAKTKRKVIAKFKKKIAKKPPEKLKKIEVKAIKKIEAFEQNKKTLTKKRVAAEEFNASKVDEFDKLLGY